MKQKLLNYYRPTWWILNDFGLPEATQDMGFAAKFFDGKGRVVEQTDLGKGIFVSTVFLSFDHNYTYQGPPVLWETLVFKDGDGGKMYRYSHWADAWTGHTAVVNHQKALLRRARWKERFEWLMKKLRK